MLFVLQKTAKSIQRHLNEFFDALAGEGLSEPVSSGAWTHARAKLKHSAFIELNTESILPIVYGPEIEQSLQRWRGHRVLGIDSSILRLPKHPELFEQFTPVEVKCQFGSTGARYPQARMSVLYDLLNRVGLDGRLEPSSVGEIRLAIEQLDKASAGDVIITDRGFTGYRYLAELTRRNLHFVSRCPRSSFVAAEELFRKNRGGLSVVAKLMVPAEQKAEVHRLGLPVELRVRFISLRLRTGELEVLVTSLVDEQKYPTQEFLQVYGERWHHETFYYLMKSRLDLENFSGQTAEAVRQDFHSTLLLCNLEVILTAPARTALAQRSATHQHPKGVNHADSFHAIKHRLLELLYSDTPAAQIIIELQTLFQRAAISQRKNRKVARPKASFHRSYYHQKCVKKITF